MQILNGIHKDRLDNVAASPNSEVSVVYTKSENVCYTCAYMYTINTNID